MKIFMVETARCKQCGKIISIEIFKQFGGYCSLMCMRAGMERGR